MLLVLGSFEFVFVAVVSFAASASVSDGFVLCLEFSVGYVAGEPAAGQTAAGETAAGQVAAAPYFAGCCGGGFSL